MTRTVLPVPALIVASIEVRPPASRPEPATSSAGKPALRICGAITRCRRSFQSPVGLPGVPPIVASPSATPDRPRPGENKSNAASGRLAAFALSASVDPLWPDSDSRPAPRRNARSLMSRPSASIGHRRGPRERDALAAALCGETRKFKPRRRPAEQPPARRQREAARVPAEVEVARRRVSGRRQLDAGDRLPADFGPRELREPGDDLRAPEVSDLEVDLEALESIRVDGHPVAVRRDRKHLLALGDGGARFRLEERRSAS